VSEQSTSSLRDLVLGSKGRSAEVVISGRAFTVREPSWRVRKEFLEIAGMTKLDAGGAAKANEGVDVAKMTEALVYLVVACTYNEDGSKVFSDADKSLLLDLPPSGALKQLADAAQKLMNEEAAAAGKT